MSGYELLRKAWFCKAHGSGVHLVADYCCTLKFFYLLLFFGRAHLHNGTNKFDACRFLLLNGVYAEQVEYLYLSVVAIRWKEVYAAFLSHRFVANALERFHGGCVSHADTFCHIFHAVNTAIPHDIFNVDIVADECLCAVIEVDNTDKTVSVESEIIKK